MEQFVLTDTGIVRALVDAHRRGVSVRVLFDPDQHPTDPHAATLRDAGVDVRLYRGSGEKLHAKAAVADGETVVFGSANWTNSGFQHNHEIDVEITGSPAVAHEFESHMNADWAASAT
jgi:phosphatidylserine/phosphatidylglycerophosphate/cardiolipin synthase-like enzyme